LVVVSVFLLTAWHGQSVWWSWEEFGQRVLPVPAVADFLEKTVGLAPPLDLVMLLGVVAVPLTILTQIRTAVRHVLKHGTPPGADDGGATAPQAALGRAIPILIVASAASASFVLLPDLFLHHPRAVFTLFGLAFTQVTSNLMIAHVCQLRFRPSPVALLAAVSLPATALVLQRGLGWSLDPASTDSDNASSAQIVIRLVLAAATALVAVDTVNFLYSSAVTLAQALDIFVFVLGKRSLDPSKAEHGATIAVSNSTPSSASSTPRSTTPSRASG
jgi:hypothetical protein